MGFEGQFIKGITLKSRINVVGDKWGKEAAVKVLDALPEEPAKIMKGVIISTNWYPFQIQVDLDTTICNVVASGDDDVYMQIGEHTAKFQMDTTAIQMTTKDPWTFLQMEARIFQRYTRPGVMTVERVDAKMAIMRIVEWQTTRNACRVNRGFLKGGITIAGGKNVEVEEESCCADPGVKECIYKISWD